VDEKLSFEEFSQRVSALDREVSRRKAAEEDLRAAEEWHEALAQLSPVGIFRTDAAGNCLYVNRRWSEIAGLNADEARGSGWVNGLHPEDRERVSAAWYEAAAADRPFHAEYRFRSPAGVDTWVLGDARAVKGPGGRLLGYVGTITDITDRKAVETDLRERVKELNCLYSLTRVLGRPEAPIRKVLQDAVATLPEAWLYPEVACARIALGECEYVTPDFRETSWRLASAIPLRGRERAWVEVCYRAERPPRDEGPFLKEERHLLNEVAARLAEALERRRALEDQALIHTLAAKAEELERFGHTVSHELKTPLTAIRGFLGLMASVDAVRESDRLDRYLVRATEAAEEMSKRLAGLLELSRVGGLVRLEGAVEFAAVARDAASMFEAPCAARGIRLELGKSFPLVRGDPARLREVLENLLDNAIKFMGDQAAPRVLIGMRREGEEPVFFVSDNGAGVAAADRERIFDLFTHLQPDTEGAGAGLAIAKRIVDAHGGRIWVESEGLGKGASFCFTLGAGRGNGLPQSVSAKE